jgi:hypothetical protein
MTEHEEGINLLELAQAMQKIDDNVMETVLPYALMIDPAVAYSGLKVVERIVEATVQMEREGDDITSDPRFVRQSERAKMLCGALRAVIAFQDEVLRACSNVSELRETVAEMQAIVLAARVG